MLIHRDKRLWLGLFVLLLLGIGVRASHVWLPGLWLPADASALQPSDPVQRVDPHLYDTQWFDAARAGRVDITDALLKAGYPIDSRTGSGYTALVLATYHGSLEEVTRLLDGGANPCIADHNGNTALMGALFKGENPMAQRLLGLCPIDQANNAGQTALSFAALFGRLDMIEALVRRGADLEHLDASGHSVRMVVQQQGNLQAVAALDAAGAGR
ncbi:ankyrin repeat domain-containing protein [Pseudomonas sp. dw_358]|uniref:ankyrin repeat domain-containing protein n=1 Tax=Pseudomonas sp. dw_358 TaxID=2720083 RepID=UPI001BD69A82|nr:ankyrin repeat domain-containing protein [Pseudomonas sp. dw_358]